MTKVITKPELILSSKLALKAKGRTLDPEFLASLRDDLRYLVDRALEFEESRNFVRCWIGIGSSVPATDFDCYLMDIPTNIFENLMTAEELLGAN